MDLDHRQHPYRDDLAAAYLQGHVEATDFTAGERRRVAQGVADLRRAPEDQAPLDSQLLAGEVVTVYDERDGWAWVQNDTDGYVGYLDSSAIGGPPPEPTHCVTALRTFVFPEPDLKRRPQELYCFSSAVSLVETEGRYGRLAEGGWIYLQHLTPLDEIDPDYVATALKFLGTPYLWGGRSSIGLDCSALLQLSLARAGVACPRDSDQQQDTVGEPFDPAGPTERGDLLWFPGHCAIALDAEQVVHANAYHMAVTIEPLAAVIARVEQQSGRGLTHRKRPNL